MSVKVKEQDLYSKKIIKILSGPVLFALSLILLPTSTFSWEIRGAIGLFLWMSAWWVSLPVAVPVTALLPIAVNAVFGFIPLNEIAPNYASPLVFLLLGASIITTAWSATNLNKRIALRALSLIGPSMKSQLAVWFIGSVVMSIFLPNIIVAATLTPIALSMLENVQLDDPSKSLSATNVLLAIAWGAGIGGFGSPLGGGMNLITIGYIEQITGVEYMYIDWVLKMAPMLIVITIGCLFYMFNMKSEAKSLPGAKEYFIEEYNKLGKMTKEEKLSLTIFVIPVILAFTRELYKDLLPALSSSYVFIVFGIVVFALPGKMDGKLMTWKYAQPKISWGLFYTLAGGLALGTMIISSGASEMVAGVVSRSNITGGLLLVAIFVALGTFLSNISSNNAACAIIIPIVISITVALDINPIGYIYLASIGGNLAFLLPTSTRAMAVSAGVSPSYMLKKGIIINIVAAIIAIVFGVIMLQLPFFVS